MVRPATTLPVAAALGLALMGDSVSARPLKYAPVTLTNGTVTLGKNHPAFGAPMANSSVIEVDDRADPDIDAFLATLVDVNVSDTSMFVNSSGPANFKPFGGVKFVSNYSTSVNYDFDDNDDTDNSDESDVDDVDNVYDFDDADDASETDDNDDACDPGFGSDSGRRHRKLRSRKTKANKAKRRTRTLEESSTDVSKLETYFGTSMEMNINNLPTVGVYTPSPWPGPYWPMYQDGINVIWSSGEASAAEKYATAFGLDVSDFMDKISAASGIDAESGNTACTTDDDCSSLNDESVCAIRTDKSSGYCIPTWYGICHAWTPAALLEDEPQCDVTYNGVTFHVMDLKALVTQVYDGADVETVFTGVRYNGESDSTDKYGRHSNSAYRDLNPGFFHVAITNLLGSLNHTFIIDYAADADVWNQPVRGFKVKETQRYTLEEAGEDFYGVNTYPYNSEADSIMYVETRLSWVYETYTDGPLVSSGEVDSYTTGAYYTYLLELDESDNIIGGEWIWNSSDTHPDFLWFPTGKPDSSLVTEVGLSYANVMQLLESAQNC